MNSIGTGIYLGASIIDHSCRPNALATFDGTTIQIRLLEDYNGSEIDFSKIFISYIDLMDSPDVRKEKLLAQYYFDCKCARCGDEQEAKLMNSGVCPNSNCDEPVSMSNPTCDKCPKCDTVIKNFMRDKFREVSAITTAQLAKMKDIAYLDVCQLCLKKQENVLHYYNVLHQKTLDHAFESAINMGKWEEAVQYGLRLREDFTKYNGPFHPLCGLLLLKLGKIQLFLAQPAEALKSIHDGEKILSITHGKEHDLYKNQLVPLLCQAATEFEIISKGTS